jgi:hypothetical protein
MPPELVRSGDHGASTVELVYDNVDELKNLVRPINEAMKALEGPLSSVDKIAKAVERPLSAMDRVAKAVDRDGWEKAAAASRMYRAASPEQQRRMAHMTVRQIFTLHQRRGLSPAGPGRTPRPIAREPRRQRTVRRAHGVRAGPLRSDDDSSSDVDALPEAGELRGLRRERRRAAQDQRAANFGGAAAPRLRPTGRPERRRGEGVAEACLRGRPVTRSPSSPRR